MNGLKFTMPLYSDITLDSDWRLIYDGSTYNFTGIIFAAG